MCPVVVSEGVIGTKGNGAFIRCQRFRQATAFHQSIAEIVVRLRVLGTNRDHTLKRFDGVGELALAKVEIAEGVACIGIVGTYSQGGFEGGSSFLRLAKFHKREGKAPQRLRIVGAMLKRSAITFDRFRISIQKGKGNTQVALHLRMVRLKTHRLLETGQRLRKTILTYQGNSEEEMPLGIPGIETDDLSTDLLHLAILALFEVSTGQG